MAMITGQTEYQSTNALFLSGNSVILMCVDHKTTAVEQRGEQILYWMSALHTAALASKQKLRVIMCATHCDKMKRKASSPFLAVSDQQKLTEFSATLSVEPEWYRLNALNPSSSHIKRLRVHCQRIGYEMSANT